MRPTTFDSSVLREHLRQHRIADLPKLKRALGTSVDLTVFRKLKPLGYLTSYTHRGRFYTLAELARFDHRGLWSHEGVWFSRQGSLLATVEAFVWGSPNGYYAHELADVLHAEVQDPLRHLVQQHRLSRTEIQGRFLYTALDPVVRRHQTLARRSAQGVPMAVHSEARPFRVSPSARLRTPAKTRYPRSSKCRAQASPMPVDAPVMTTAPCLAIRPSVAGAI